MLRHYAAWIATIDHAEHGEQCGMPDHGISVIKIFWNFKVMSPSQMILNPVVGQGGVCGFWGAG
jgi:hypothetical protein